MDKETSLVLAQRAAVRAETILRESEGHNIIIDQAIRRALLEVMNEARLCECTHEDDEDFINILPRIAVQFNALADGEQVKA